MGTYILYVRVNEIDAPSYLSEYVLRVRIDNPGGIVVNEDPREKLTGIIMNDQLKSGKIGIIFSQPIVIPP